MVKNNCDNCWNRASDGFCTLNTKTDEDMKQSYYKQCDGWKEIHKKVVVKKSQEKIEEEKSQRELRMLAKIDVGTSFQRFLDKGGGYSFRTGEYIGNNDD